MDGLVAFVRTDPGADVLVVTNMWPEPDRPVYGIHVQRQVESLVRAGIRCDVLYVRGYRSALAYPLAAAPLPLVESRLARTLPPRSRLLGRDRPRRSLSPRDADRRLLLRRRPARRPARGRFDPVRQHRACAPPPPARRAPDPHDHEVGGDGRGLARGGPPEERDHPERRRHRAVPPAPSWRGQGGARVDTGGTGRAVLCDKARTARPSACRLRSVRAPLRLRASGLSGWRSLPSSIRLLFRS